VHERHRPGSPGGGGLLNQVQAFLQANASRLGLARYGVTGETSCILLTPRFRASRHVVFLLLPAGSEDPGLVAKVPRLGGDVAGLLRERDGLAAAQAHSGAGASIPRLLAFDKERSLLVESAIPGRPLGARDVRRGDEWICTVVDWLVDLPRTQPRDDDYERLVERPLQRFARELGGADAELVERTLELLAPLRSSMLQPVVEHGDLSEPNLIRSKAGGLGVVDWELSEERGLPLHDLHFFLAYVAFARARASTADRCAAAAHDAFVARDGWARPFIRDYAHRVGVPQPLLARLFVATWARYAGGLLARLAEGPVAPETAAWLRENRFYALWRLAVRHAGELGHGD
jgi:aminoglycoside phosphotransferase